VGAAVAGTEVGFGAGALGGDVSGLQAVPVSAAAAATAAAPAANSTSRREGDDVLSDGMA